MRENSKAIACAVANAAESRARSLLTWCRSEAGRRERHSPPEISGTSHPRYSQNETQTVKCRFVIRVITMETLAGHVLSNMAKRSE